ncbi:MAG: DUF802 domain-containing protein, partial [Pseudoxanthomonas sp.]
MLRTTLNLAVFLAGLLIVCWIGAGYVGSHPLGVMVTLVIAIGYLVGGLELYRYRQATASLADALVVMPTPSDLGDWLARLHPSVRNAVRLRIEGGRVALPGPVMTPYLVGLLVLLGMLGTLLGMMATLRGTGLALESATDLHAMRASLAAPVKGLAFAFGTSIAGVASSAMLGLLSSLCRRERLTVVQSLDANIATTLRIHSQAYQREEAYKLLQQQAALMPTLVDRLQAMVTTLEQQGIAANERMTVGQANFHTSTEALHSRLASSMEQALAASVIESARAAGAALQPAMENTLAGLALESTRLHETVSVAVQRQLEGVSAGFDAITMATASSWNTALEAQQQSNQALTDALGQTLERFTDTFQQRSTELLHAVDARLDAAAAQAATTWSTALSGQEAANEGMAARNEQAIGLAAANFEAHASSLVSVMRQSHLDLQTALQAQDQQRMAAWGDTFDAITVAAGKQWEHAGARMASQQQEVCDTLARTAGDISTQAQLHASDTITEISRLVQAASEAPKAAAEVVAELRQKLSDSLVRDNAMLDERGRLLATLETLLDAVNHGSTEQRAAVDALVATSADLLDRVGTRFTDHIEAETGKLGTVAAQLTGSAVEVASLGDAFGTAVQLFGKSSEALVERLQHIETALGNSLARSDEQLGYYVAQAREVIDLSM